MQKMAAKITKIYVKSITELKVVAAVARKCFVLLWYLYRGPNGVWKLAWSSQLQHLSILTPSVVHLTTTYSIPSVRTRDTAKLFL